MTPEHPGTPGRSTPRPHGRSGQATGALLALGAGIGVVAGAVLGAEVLPLALVVGAGIGVAVGAAVDARRHGRAGRRDGGGAQPPAR